MLFSRVTTIGSLMAAIDSTIVILALPNMLQLFASRHYTLSVLAATLQSLAIFAVAQHQFNDGSRAAQPSGRGLCNSQHHAQRRYGLSLCPEPRRCRSRDAASSRQRSVSGDRGPFAREHRQLFHRRDEPRLHRLCAYLPARHRLLRRAPAPPGLTRQWPARRGSRDRIEHAARG
jgi:hypothetical protein